MQKRQRVSLPFEHFFARTDLKMAFGNAEVEARIADEGELGLGFHAVVVVQDENKLLLVDGCRCE